MFDYLRRVWAKLESDSVMDSVAKNSDIDNAQHELLNFDPTEEDDNIEFEPDSSSTIQSSGDAEVSELFTNPNERNMSGFNDGAFNMFNDDDDDFFN